VLVAHEVAYAIGQLKDERAIPVLSEVLANTEQHPVVRHEAAEALGAIGSQKSVPVLEKFSKSPHVEVSESCEIALELLRWTASNEGKALPYSGFDSVWQSYIVAYNCV
jgi:deoxyhypusine monooxygenase